MIRSLRWLAAAAFALLPSVALAQSTLLQGGSWSTGRIPMYVGQTGGQVIVQDSGPASGGGPGIGISEWNVTARGTGTAPYAGQGTGPNGEVACIFDAPATNSTGYHSLCFSANVSSGGLISYQANGAATAYPFNFKVNGVNYQFPFTTSGVVGPATSVIGDAACWNNTSGTLLADCGPFVTVGGNNTWTGTNNFTGTFQKGGVTQTFPASGSLVGTSDVQTLTNKSIGASQINSGTLSAVVMPAYTGDVTSSAGATVNTIAAGAVTNAKLAAATQNTLKGAATSTAVTDLAVPSCSGASNALQWVTNTGLQCGTLGATTAGWGLTLSGGGVFSIATAQPPYSFDVPINMGLTASVGASALTISVTGANGSAPSATNPVSVPFRSLAGAGTATGTPVWTAITSALSIVIPSAATLGTSNGTPFRIWIFLAYNSGVPELAVATCSISTTIFPCSSWETIRKTTTTIDGFATTAGAPYVTAGVSNDTLRIIGYCEYASGLATAGAYASVCTTLQLFGPGVKKPGDVVQTATALTSSTTTTTSSTYQTSANQVAIIPSSTANPMRIVSAGTMQFANTNQRAQVQIFRGATGIGQSFLIGPYSGSSPTNPNGIVNTPATNSAIDFPSTVSNTTYSVKILSSDNSSSINYPTTSGGSIIVDEIMGFDLREPANDNIDPGVFSATG